MPSGLDASTNCGPNARCILDAGYDFVCRYYANKGSKRLTSQEAHQLCAVGLKLVVVWESNPTSTEYFSYAKGVDDGTSAYHDAMQIGQPADSVIYFAVDYDAPQNAISGAIADYFRGVTDGFNTISGNRPAQRVGVYGSGAVCAWLLARKMVSYTWLAQSTGWSG